MHDNGKRSHGIGVVDRRGHYHGGAGLHGLDRSARQADGIALNNTPRVGLVGGVLG